MAVNPNVLWLTRSRSELVQQVMQGLSCECEIKALDSILQCNSAGEAMSGHGVAVIEPVGLKGLAEPNDLIQLAKLLKCSFILVLLPKAVEHQTSAWLNAGADRCLPVDTSIVVVQAMLRALLNRCCGQLATYTEHGSLRFEHDTNTLVHENARVELTYKETLLTSLLLRNVHRHLRRDELFQVLCSDGKGNSDPALVSLYIHRLNKKLRGYGVRIAHKRGYGYRILEDFPHDRAASAIDGSSPEQKLSRRMFDRELFRQTWLRF